MTKNTDRLGQIWGRLQTRASVDLSGTTVDHTQRPSREYGEDLPNLGMNQPLRASHMPEGVTDPVSAALGAMRAQMADAAKSGRRKKKVQPGAQARFDMAPPETSVEKTLFADMAFTESKVNRREADYITFAAGRQADWQRRKRKKFLGIF